MVKKGGKSERTLFMKNQVELLAPAGSYDSMVAAINAGADAVYIGGEKFGARAYVDKLDEKTMCKAIDYAHIHGRKLYLTVNTLLKQNELYKELYNYLLPMYRQGIDAVIVQDIGVFEFIRKNFPDLDIHASTQMNITGVNGAKLLKEMGATRIVVARELSLEEIKQIHNECDIEIESFIHGALCYCYSGQCLFSSLVGGRSGNRGRCAQPCRLAYDVLVNDEKILDQGYVLSMKDLNTIEILPKIIESGIYSLKIEGRMKKVEYTAGVVSIYRKYIDLYLKREKYKVAKEDMQILFDLFNRNGFTKGYYDCNSSKDMVTMKKPEFRAGNDKLMLAIKSRYLDNTVKEEINGTVSILANTPLKLELQYKNISVNVTGEIPSVAQKQPVKAENIKRQLKKMGDTQFALKNLDVILGENLFVPMSWINDIRRKAIEELEEEIVTVYRRAELNNNPEKSAAAYTVNKNYKKRNSVISASVETKSQLDAILKVDKVSRIYIESTLADFPKLKDIVILVKEMGKSIYLAFPYVFRKKAIAYFDEYIDDIKKAEFDGFLVRNLESVGYIKNHGLVGDKIIDHTLYSFNKESRRVYKEWANSLDTIPLELNDKEILSRGYENSEFVIYGYLPMMITAGCLKKNVIACDGRFFNIKLQDRLNKTFVVKNYCKYCYNIIYNSSPLSLLDKAEEIKYMGIRDFRLAFTTENKDTVLEIAKRFVEVYVNNAKKVKNIDDFTRGHYKRGVE